MSALLDPPEVKWSTRAEVQRIAEAIGKEWDDLAPPAGIWLNERIATGDSDVNDLILAALRIWSEDGRLECDRASTRLKTRYCAWREASLTKLEADEMGGTVETEYEE